MLSDIHIYGIRQNTNIQHLTVWQIHHLPGFSAVLGNEAGCAVRETLGHDQPVHTQEAHVHNMTACTGHSGFSPGHSAILCFVDIGVCFRPPVITSNQPAICGRKQLPPNLRESSQVFFLVSSSQLLICPLPGSRNGTAVEELQCAVIDIVDTWSAVLIQSDFCSLPSVVWSGHAGIGRFFAQAIQHVWRIQCLRLSKRNQNRQHYHNYCCNKSADKLFSFTANAMNSFL